MKSDILNIAWKPLYCRFCHVNGDRGKGCKECYFTGQGTQWFFMESLNTSNNGYVGSEPIEIMGFGGAAGGGKTECILAGFFRNAHLYQYRALVLRISQPATLEMIDRCDIMMKKIFGSNGYIHNKKHNYFMVKASEAKIYFSNLSDERSFQKVQGQQFQYIAVDECGQYDDRKFAQVEKIMSWVRTTRGYPTQFVMTANPGGLGQINMFKSFQPFIDPNFKILLTDSEHNAILKDGQMQYFKVKKYQAVHRTTTIDNETGRSEYTWSMYPTYITREGRKIRTSKKCLFIKSTVFDNYMLGDEYISSLYSLRASERAYFLEGDWTYVPQAGDYFARKDFKPFVTEEKFYNSRAHGGMVLARVRAWDRASQVGKSHDYTVGVLMCLVTTQDRHYKYVIEDVIRTQVKASMSDSLINETYRKDPAGTIAILPVDPAQAGDYQAGVFLKEARARGMKVEMVRTGKLSKSMRSLNYRLQVLEGKVHYIVPSSENSFFSKRWHNTFLNEHEAFPIDRSGHDDQVDAATLALDALLDFKLNNKFTIGITDDRLL